MNMHHLKNSTYHPSAAAPLILVLDGDPRMHAHYAAMLHQSNMVLLDPALDCSSAQEILQNCHPQAAILDITEACSQIWALADRLTDSGINFLLTSATPHDRATLPAAHSAAICLTKPLTREQLLMGLHLLCDAAPHKGGISA